MGLPKLDPGIKKQWLEALRSGKYEQGTDFLKHSQGKQTSFCCLGVLGEIRGCRSSCDLGTRPDGTTQVYEKSKGLQGGYLLPETANTWGLTPEIQIKLSEFNDDGKSFKWIAAYIERYL